MQCVEGKVWGGSAATATKNTPPPLIGEFQITL